ncbi:NusB antitermination factor [Ferrithrix thermotolerans DSM 19514]|uniref:Transcription antitermination protein NusB n=1 Tax=Ferrithrix thermotolerans DSM 19514 TaxID=1121881 RepID=A0A1M4T4Y9_9ACTN|nr:transcription antitermination factor NusB [Ferrithrix thermotolerans]SHE39572.1 NusB antitermination factor [Ferrithrix thermotolerans DSM 19514]
MNGVDVRRSERERVLTLLYQAEILDIPIREVLGRSTLPESEFVTDRVLGVAEHQELIDRTCSQHLNNWELARMPSLDRNILRLAVYELIYASDVTAPVAISEAVELAKTFSTSDSGRFVNGVLAEVQRTLHAKEAG